MKFLLLSAFLAAGYACKLDGVTRANEETWVARKMFTMRCVINKDSSWKTEVVGCASPTGAEVPIGGQVIEEGIVYSCNRGEDGRINYRKAMHPTTFCEGHQLGDTWIHNKNFNRSCSERGLFVVNCLTDSGAFIPLNGQVTEGPVLFKCTEESNGTVLLHRGRALEKVNLQKLALSKLKENIPLEPQMPFVEPTTVALPTLLPEVTTAAVVELASTEAATQVPVETTTAIEVTESTTALETSSFVEEATTVSVESTTETEVQPGEVPTLAAPAEPLPPIAIDPVQPPTVGVSLNKPEGPKPPGIRPPAVMARPEPPVEEDNTIQQVVPASDVISEAVFPQETVEPVTSQPIHIVHPPAIRPPPGFSHSGMSCLDEGVVRQPEDTWVVEGKFRKTCTEQGAVRVLECLIDDQTPMPVNTDRMVGQRLHRCWRQGDQVFYEARDLPKRRRHF
ncbi:unnamed protein product, partial [Mesorhabditis spiculigera]